MSRRSKRVRPKPEPAAAESDSSDESDHDGSESPPRRVSSRSTKFTQSMKEKSDSIADLFRSEAAPPAQAKAAAKGKGKRRSGGSTASNDSDEESDGDDSHIEPAKKAPFRNRARQTRGRKQTPEKAQRGRRTQPKSPAVRHKTKRRIVKTEVHVSSDDSESEFSEDGESELEREEEEELKIQRIIASRLETRRKWREICEKMNTSEIENGSRWFQDDDECERGDDTFEERFLVKWTGLSYLHCSWELEEDLLAQIEGSKAYLTTFFRKGQNGLLFDADERGDGECFDPSFVQVERILEIGAEAEESGDTKKKSRSKRGDGGTGETEESSGENKYGIIMDKDHPDYENGTGRQFLVKWGNTPYSESTYEFERDLILNDVEYEEHVASFIKRREKPTKADMKKVSSIHEEQMRRLYKTFGDKAFKSDEDREKKVKAYQMKLEEHVFPNGGQLRDYQAEGVSWMISNYINKRCSILADEMGLGKTIQTAVLVNYLATALSSRGPYLIIAPLSTLQHWYREFSGWTNLNTIVYHGSAKDRECIREFEMAFEEDRPSRVGANATFLKRCHKRTSPKWERTWMASVIITTPEMLVTDDFSELTAVKWELLVVDEAHRLKNHTSKLASNLRDERFSFKSTLLLTGTPIQNNMTEMWTLLNIVDPKTFDDMDEFLEQYGDIKSKEKLDELHERIRPYILRRLKEDVEKSVPPKEETLIEVELTVLQKQYYRALYEKNVQFLHRNKKKALDGPSISNLAMQLRKCCNHPFLLRGVEEEVRAQKAESGSEGDFLVKASGKLVLLDKLLPKLKQGGHRLLIFSQFKIMLDILEDYLEIRSYRAERIDGSITGKKRQMAIDRFQAKESESFVMLLSTRAGGVGINLTAADTCIIFDSDWNPQNDLQAQARCHRIGQTKSVKVYRLLSRKTYEMQMFHMSSLKMGLDQAVLQGIEAGSGGGNEGTLTKEEVEKLLRHGAYDIFNEEKSGASEKESDDFVAQDIDSILARRTKTVIHENTGSKSSAAGGTFSKASFKASGSSAHKSSDTAAEDVDIDDPEFWKKMVGEARVEDDHNNLEGKKRKRKEANYSEKDYERRITASIEGVKYSSAEGNDGSSSDEDDSASSDEDNEFDASGKQDLKNEILKKLQEERKKRKQNREKSRWGGKGTNDWRKADAEAVLKGLQTYGYGNMPWDELAKRMEFERPETYSSDEMKRMCWAMSLTLLREAVDDEVRDAARRAERAAEKKRVAGEDGGDDGPPSDGGVLGNAKSKSQDELEKEVSLSFEKVWSTNSVWASKAIEDAIEYTKGHTPRSQDIVKSATGERKDSPKKLTPLAQAFNENVWPALRSRGWKEEDVTEGKKRYSYGGQVYRSVSAVLDAVPKIHPELSNTIESIISSVAAGSFLTGTNEDASNSGKEETAVIDPRKVSVQALTALLRNYGPLQLLVDRTKASKIAVHPRKFLGIMSLLGTAHALVASVDGESDYEKVLNLEKLISLDRRVALPHPSWKPRHDAVLIKAIAKHGWIDRERACHAIAQDSSIKWGPPFDDGYDVPSEDNSGQVTQPPDNISFDELKAVADRAAAFFNMEGSLLHDLKGFNMELVIRSYGLTQRRTTDIPNPPWEVDEALLKTLLSNGGHGRCTENEESIPEIQDLPPRKDLVKRAKMILSRSSNSVTPAPGGQHDDPNQESSNATPAHNFCVLDQSDVCNILLAELLRGVLKVSVTKGNGQKVCRRLLHHALKEVERKMATAAQCKPDAETSCKPDADSSSDAAQLSDTKKLQENLRLVSRTIKSWHRQAKNVLRCILGMEPIQPKNDGSMFPVERYTALPSTANVSSLPSSAALEQIRVEQIRQVKRVQQKQKESAAGDIAINRALAAGLQKGKKKQAESDGGDNDIPVPSLKLTSIETLLLSVICSQGLPVWTEDWESLVDPQCCVESEVRPGDDFVINWYRMGGVVLNAAIVWQEIASKNLQQKFSHLERNKKNLSAAQVQDLTRECRQLQQDVDRKLQAIADARQLRADPHQLARKSVMMLESLRRVMGPVETKSAGALKTMRVLSKQENGLGPRVVQWCCKELNRWGNSLNIVDESGRCISSTASDYVGDLPDINLAAYFDKKACRTIFIQISQQTRLRSIFIKNGVGKISSLLPKALKNSRHNGDVWDRCPHWWCNVNEHPGITSCKDDIDLLAGLLDFGYSGFDEMVKQNSSFRVRIDEEKKQQENSAESSVPPLSVLTRASAQQRVNHLTRELNALEDTADVMRLVSERANRNVVTLDQAGSCEEDDNGSKRLSSVQTGIDNFFKSSQAGSKKPKTSIPSPKVSDTESVSSVEIVEVEVESGGPTEKRKSGESNGMDALLSASKKQKAS